MFGVCSYFILEQDKLIIIDPGKFDDSVFAWLNKFIDLRKIVYITHEHFDHHYNANKVFDLENTYFFSPFEKFDIALRDIRKNLSFYYNDPIKTVAVSKMFESFLKVIKTPGHSEESYCFVYDNILFGGDTIIDKKYLVLKLPGSNKKDYENSINLLKEQLVKDSIVLPGHGEFFDFEKW